MSVCMLIKVVKFGSLPSGQRTTEYSEMTRSMPGICACSSASMLCSVTTCDGKQCTRRLDSVSTISNIEVDME